MINFITNNNHSSLILFVHGFTGRKDTWKHPQHDSFPNLLLQKVIFTRKEKELKSSLMKS